MQSTITASPRSSRVFAALSALISNFCLGLVALGILLTVAPQTALSLPFESAWQAVLAALNPGENGAGQNLDQVAYFVGYALLVGSLSAYAVARRRARIAAEVASFADVGALLSALLLLDPFLSIARDFTFQNRWWGFYAASTFFIVLLCGDQKRAWRLIQFVLFCIGVQALYAVAFYALGINQFQGARFGARTGGTFGSPNPLYPLCLLAIPLALTLNGVASSIEWRWALRTVAGLSVLALLLTFTRGAWLALAALALYFAASRHSPFAGRTLWRGLVVLGVGALLLGVLVVRTRGGMIGRYSDSSFWGRIYIWQVAARAVADKPVLGSGINTYAMQQRRFMTPRLQKFRPANIEAKSLGLNVAVESGLLGLGLLLWGGWRFFKLSKYGESIPTAEEEDARIQALRVGAVAALLALGVAGVVDTPILGTDRVAPTLALAALLGACCVTGKKRDGQKLWSEVSDEPLRATKPLSAPDMAAFVDASRSTRILQAALCDLDALLAGQKIEYWVIGSCARFAYMGRAARKVSDLDLIVPDREALEAVAPQLRDLGERHGLFVDASLSRVFRANATGYSLNYGPLSYELPSPVMQAHRVRWGEAEFATLPPQTLLHTFGLVAEPLRAQDRRSAREFARFLKGHREFDPRLFEPFHLFWRAHWRYFPLKPVQYWWRQRIKALPRGVRLLLLRRIYPTLPIRALRGALTYLETRVCLAPRNAPARRASSIPLNQPTLHANLPREVLSSNFKRRGFTLVEMVVVLVIIGLLAALIFPAVSKSRQRAHQTTCAGTLRQFGIAFTMYAQDFDGRLPNPGGWGMQAGNGQTAVLRGDNGAVWCAFGAGKGLFAYLERQSDTANNHWSCPSSLPFTPTEEEASYNVGQTYSMNDYLRAKHPGQSITAEGDVPGEFNPGFHTGVKLDEVVAASQMILLFEGVEHPRGGARRNGSPYFGTYPSRYGSSDLPRNVPEEYHFGMSNFLFCDGHVKAMRPTQTWTRATQFRVEKLNYGYANARGGRVGNGTSDLWNPQTAGVVYP